MVKIKFNNSLKKQLLLGIFCGIIILIVLLDISQYYFLKKNLYESKIQLLESRLHNIYIYKLKDTNNEIALRANAQGLIDASIDMDVGISIIDQNGNVMVDSKSKGKTNYLKHLLLTEIPEFNKNEPLPKLSTYKYKELLKTKGGLDKNIIVNNILGTKYMVLVCKLGSLNKSYSLIQFSTSMKSIDNLIIMQLKWCFIISIILFAIMVVILRSFISFSLTPLERITFAMKKINEEKLNTRIEMLINQTEIQGLVTEFNCMLKRIETSFENEKNIARKMKKFVLDAEHELRTPLTSIQGFAEILKMGAAQDENDKALALDTIVRESKRMTRLVNKMLLLTRLDNKIYIEKKPENIKDIIIELKDELNFIVGLRTLKIYAKEDIWVNSNSDQIKQIIINLINNAAQHTDEEKGELTIILRRKLIDNIKCAVIIVSDNGIGISKNKLDKIFYRFYRVETHRSRKSGNFGLGLSIIKSIVDEYGGKIEVESEINCGSKFSVILKAI
ncbi:sensor histidine kinase [Clostridium psychrophilum]|uniref:sensor histidine kinase n=1 Tax=Clostridium psychrophilum TaxID=132926 RepID=UPI001C0C14F4|nr:HAMP domain-containing sensor histidine kinase [Clostridium psychrophilum]MBU3182298.1 HAMP domain-containing histidine kinase [Clostridium psychrophilum]